MHPRRPPEPHFYRAKTKHDVLNVARATFCETFFGGRSSIKFRRGPRMVNGRVLHRQASSRDKSRRRSLRIPLPFRSFRLPKLFPLRRLVL